MGLQYVLSAACEGADQTLRFWRQAALLCPFIPAQVWLGYQQSLRPLHMGLSLNVDLAATAFLEEQPVVNFLVRSLQTTSLCPYRPLLETVLNLARSHVCTADP